MPHPQPAPTRPAPTRLSSLPPCKHARTTTPTRRGRAIQKAGVKVTLLVNTGDPFFARPQQLVLAGRLGATVEDDPKAGHADLVVLDGAKTLAGRVKKALLLSK